MTRTVYERYMPTEIEIKNENYSSNDRNHRATCIPKKSKVATATRSVTWKDVFFGTTTRSIATRTRAAIIVTLVYLQGNEGGRGG